MPVGVYIFPQVPVDVYIFLQVPVDVSISPQVPVDVYIFLQVPVDVSISPLPGCASLGILDADEILSVVRLRQERAYSTDECFICKEGSISLACSH